MANEILDQETGDTPREMKAKEIFYNCSECFSPIEILSLDEKESIIEFNCVNNNQKRKMRIKEYINKMKILKEKNKNNINNDRCNEHNDNDFDCYCLDCNRHLCKECLKTRDHVNHQKSGIIEIKPSKKELKIIDDIIKFYDEKIENLEKEKLKKI